MSPAPILILGLGDTGYSAATHLAPRGHPLTVADTRPVPPHLVKLKTNYPQIKIITGHLPVKTFPRYARIIISPGIDLTTDHPLTSDIDLFAEATRTPTIAITGTNGKSSVTALTAAMLNAASKTALPGGNFGPPALTLLQHPTPAYYILEVSSFQLQHIRRLTPAVAAILNLTPDHLDRHQTLANYIATKAKILRHADTCVLNRDDPDSEPFRQTHPDAITFGITPPPGPNHYGITNTNNTLYLTRGTTPLAPLTALPSPTTDTIQNILAACAIVEATGLPLTPNPTTTPTIDNTDTTTGTPGQRALTAALTFPGLEHRAELVATINGTRWINDSKATNVGATASALRSFSPLPAPTIILIAGGLAKSTDFTPLAFAAQSRVRHAYLFGEDAHHIKTSLTGIVPVTCVPNLTAAVSLAATHVTPDTIVLFSPACASFDMFANYAARGRAFKALITELTAPPPPRS